MMLLSLTLHDAAEAGTLSYEANTQVDRPRWISSNDPASFTCAPDQCSQASHPAILSAICIKQLRYT